MSGFTSDWCKKFCTWKLSSHQTIIYPAEQGVFIPLTILSH